MNEPDRAEFEARFSKPPFEWNFKRRGEESAWPVSYLNLEHEYAWQGFQMALEWERGRIACATMTGSKMVVCHDCGDKRCPKATYHEAVCSNSAPHPDIRKSRNTEPPPHRPSRDIMFDTRPRDE